jgi:HK97 family phage prohead protease
VLRRTPAHDLSTRADGRTIYGIAVPFDQEATVNDGAGPYRESFKRGSFRKTIAENLNRVKLLVNHDKYQRLPIGRAEVLREDAAGLYGEWRISQTREGDETLTLVNDGVVDAFSIGFTPVKEHERSDGVVERLEVKLSEVSVVAFPAYEYALIGGVRNELGIDDNEWQRIRALVRDHPDLFNELADLGTPDAGAADPTPDDGDGSEPTDEATRDDEPLEHSSPPYTPAQRPVLTVETMRDQLRRVRTAAERAAAVNTARSLE